MIHTSTQPNSEQQIMDEVFRLADAGASVIQIRTREPIRTALVLRKSILTSDQCEYREWDVVNGFRSFTTENYTNNRPKGDDTDAVQALMTPLMQLRDPASSPNAKTDTVHYFVYVNPHPFLEKNPFVTELIQQYAAILPMTNICMLFITPDMPLDDIPVGTVLVTHMPTPSSAELEAQLTRIIDNSKEDFINGSALDEEDIRRVANMGLGLSLYEFETYAAIAVINANAAKEETITADMMLTGIAEGKTSVVKQSEILELLAPADMKNVGGMKRLKDWVASRANCYSDEATEFGIEPPKGMVVVGVPGAGKSLLAKAVSNEFAVPLVKLDFGRVFSKYVGDSESRVRQALKMVEDMAPVVLFVDEIDKGLGGIGGGGGDSGTSSRVLGSFLSWLQDNTAPVFVIVTANRVDGLPPELLRRGRFDQIFSVTLPTASERLEVLNIHMRKRGKKVNFAPAEIGEFTTVSENYVPAEIESAVKDALILAFNEGVPVAMRHIVTALREMVPMSKSYAKQIDAMVAWAKDNATPVNYVETDEEAAPAEPQSRRIGRTRR